jgi:hypothetical protein
VLIGNNAVFSLGLGNADWLGSGVKEIHDGRAGKLEGVGVYCLLQGRQAVFIFEFLEENQNFELVAEIGE